MGEALSLVQVSSTFGVSATPVPGISSASTGIFYVTPTTGSNPVQIYSAPMVRGLLLSPHSLLNAALDGITFGSTWQNGPLNSPGTT